MGADHRRRAPRFMRPPRLFNCEEDTPRPEILEEIVQNMDYKLLFISVCVLHLSMHCQGRPLRKRTVSEVQFMHNLGEHRQLQERRDWLQMRLRGVHTAAAAAAAARDVGGEEANRLRRRRLSVEALPQLKNLTPEEIQLALNFLEKLLKSKQS